MPFQDQFAQATNEAFKKIEQPKFLQLTPSEKIKAESQKNPSMKFVSQYNTGLSPDEMKEFQDWGIKKYGSKENLLREMGSYDIQGAWKAIKNKEIDYDPMTGHLPDTYKKPNHITFSSESKYADGQGGQWNQVNNRWQFKPSQKTLEIYGKQALEDYFKKYEPDSDLIY